LEPFLVSFPTSPRNASGELTLSSVPPISAAAGLGSKAYEQGVQY
jgi:hypothetical protein